MDNGQKRGRFPVFHVPHDGAVFPAELLRSVCVPRERFLHYHEKMRDLGAPEMVPRRWRDPAHTLRFPVSRLLCDVERFLGPEEPMERHGMGFCYERAYDGTRIKELSEELKRDTLAYFRQHHARLDRLCGEHPRILLIDLHSFSDELVPREQLRHGRRTPELCLGLDGRFTPEELAAAAERIMGEAGFATARNYPYSGSLVPGAVLAGRCGCDCVSIMLEWNRRAFCSEDGSPAEDKLERIQSAIERLVEAGRELG